MKFKLDRKISAGDRVFYITVDIIMFLVLLAVIIPILHVFSASFSRPSAVTQGKVFLFPVGFSLDGYKAVFRDQSIITGYLNTILYTIVGTVFNLVITIMCAFPLSRKELPLRNQITFIFAFTMMFGGGLIPSYLLMRTLGFIDSRWVMIIPGALSVYNMVVTRTFFQTSIPEELAEATKIDGGTDYTYLFKIVLPLSKPIIAVLALYYGVGHWNSYFSAFLYLNTSTKFPLQLVLKDILISNNISADMLISGEGMLQDDLSDILKYAVIIVASLPIWIVYPFLQKYFVKGVMIGSIKG